MVNKKILIVGVLIVSLVSVKLLSSLIFLGDSPLVNPQFIANLQTLPQTIARLPTTGSNFRGGRSEVATPNENVGGTVPDTAEVSNQYISTLSSLADSVSAQEVGGIIYQKVGSGTGDRSQIQITTKCGTVVTLSFPTNQPPLQHIVDYIQEGC